MTLGVVHLYTNKVHPGNISTMFGILQHTRELLLINDKYIVIFMILTFELGKLSIWPTNNIQSVNSPVKSGPQKGQSYALLMDGRPVKVYP